MFWLLYIVISWSELTKSELDTLTTKEKIPRRASQVNCPITIGWNLTVNNTRKKHFEYNTEGSSKFYLRTSWLFYMTFFSHTENIHEVEYYTTGIVKSSL